MYFIDSSHNNFGYFAKFCSHNVLLGFCFGLTHSRANLHGITDLFAELRLRTVLELFRPMKICILKMTVKLFCLHMFFCSGLIVKILDCVKNIEQ